MSTKSPQSKSSNKNPYSSISPEDFEKMCQTIDKAFSHLTKVPGKSAASAGASRASAKPAAQASAPAGVTPFGTQLEDLQANLAQASIVKGRFRSTIGLVVGGVIMAILGGMGLLALGNFIMVPVLAGLAIGGAGSAGTFAFAVLGIGAVLAAVLFVCGINNLITSSQLKALQRVVGTNEVISFADLAPLLHLDAAQTSKRVSKLIKRGLIPEGRVDDENTKLMVTAAAYQQYCQHRQSQQQLLEQQKADEKARAADEAARLAHEENLAKRLSPSARAFLAEGRDYQAKLRKLDELIDDELVSSRIVAIEGVLARILARAEDEPSVIPGINRLNNYYLPTTVKLLEAYDNLEDQPVQGENVSNSRREIEKTLEVLRSAFEKLLDDTYQEMSIDVSTDISVLHSILAREGLTDSPFSANAASAGVQAGEGASAAAAAAAATAAAADAAATAAAVEAADATTETTTPKLVL